MSLTLKYFNLPAPYAGRGGTLRFFLLTHGIQYNDVKVEFPTWAEEKKRLVESGENPCGTLPVVNPKDKKPLIQHVAIMRLLAKQNKLSSSSPLGDYIQDLVADEYQTARNRWAEVAFSGDDELKTKYAKEEFPKKLTMFDQLYGKYKEHDTYLSTSPAGNGLWGDTCMFTILFDHIQSKLLEKETLREYPQLDALYEEYGRNAAVKEYISKM